MAISTSAAEHGVFATPFAPSPRLRAAFGEIVRVRAPLAAPETRLDRSLAWIARAQDACADGSVSGGFRLVRGWRGADVESTAAAIPMLLEVDADRVGVDARRRARRAARALAELPRTTDSARLLAAALRGVCAWARAAASPADRRTAALRGQALAARLEGALDAEARLAPLPPAEVLPQAAALAAALCDAADVAGREQLAARAAAIVEAALQVSPLAETAARLARAPGPRWPHADGVAALPLLLRDLRDVALRLGRADLLALVAAEVEKLLRRFELRRRVVIAPRAPGSRPPRRFSPLAWAGAALLWIEESERTDDPRPLNAALAALDSLSQVQRWRPGVRDVDGAVPATVVAWRERRVPTYDSLTAVLLARALLAERRALATLRGLRATGARRAPVASDVPRAAVAPAGPLAELRVVLYAAPDIHRAPPLLEQWRAWGFVPAAVVMERRPRPPLARRLRDKIAADGWRVALERIARRVRPSPPLAGRESTVAYCARLGIPVVDVGALDAPETVDAVRALAPDLAIHVGSGILRAPLLGVPRLGTLNVHNGILPWFRGVNVSEWGALLGEPVGCTVHLVDPGVDTGDILLVREVEVRHARSIAELRALVDRAQGAILGEVLRATHALGALPPRRPQRADEGRQFFRMHPRLRAMLEERLA